MFSLKVKLLQFQVEIYLYINVAMQSHCNVARKHNNNDIEFAELFLKVRVSSN